MQLRHGTGYMDGHWSTAAAGHVEAGESASAAARREAWEELGVAIPEGGLHPLTAMHRLQGSALAQEGRVDFFFSCGSWTGEPKIMEPDKSAGLAWFELDDLPEPIVPHERYVLERLSSGLPPIVEFCHQNQPQERYGRVFMRGLDRSRGTLHEA